MNFSLSAKGFLDDGGWIEIAPAEHVTGIVVKMTPQSGIAGHVGTLELLVAPNAATVRGASVVKATLWSDSTVKTKETDGGTVAFGNLAPGDYRIAAWEKVNDEGTEIPEFLSRFDAQKLTLAEGSHETVEIKPISKSLIDAEVARLQ